MGTDYTQGIGFGFKTYIPCYTVSDLHKRLLWLLGIRKRKPIIAPITDCQIVSDSSVLIDTEDSAERTLIISRSTVDIISVQLSVTGGASQANFSVIYTDAEGRPPHSFECVIDGGTDADIAQVIWDNMANGIQPYGNTSEVIQDSQGEEISTGT